MAAPPAAPSPVEPASAEEPAGDKKGEAVAQPVAAEPAPQRTGCCAWLSCCRRKPKPPPPPLPTRVLDCPLTCYRDAITDMMPRRLARIAAEDPGIDAARVWTTLIVVHTLEKLPMSWMFGDGDIYEEQAYDITIVDAGSMWLEAHAEAHPLLKAALEDGELEKRAGAVAGLWKKVNKIRVHELRTSRGITEHMAETQTHRTLTGIYRAFCTQHDTFRVFLSEPLDGLQRWQMFVIIVTLVLEMLLVNIWMYYAKSLNCCHTVRRLLDSGPDGGSCPEADITGPCRGFTGDCGDLSTQFASVAVLPGYPNGLQDWSCTAFPDDDHPLDSFLVGLITVAVAIPVNWFLEACFEIANDSEAPESWLSWPAEGNWRKFIFGGNAHRKWHFTRGKPMNRHIRWYVRSAGAPTLETMENLWHSFRHWLTGAPLPWVEEALEYRREQAEAKEHGSHHGGEQHDEEGSHHEGDGEHEAHTPHATWHEGAHHDEGKHSDKASTSSSIRSARELRAYKRVTMLTGIAGCYLCWAVFAWFIFTYGSLLISLLGEGAQQSFSRSWGISYGISSASEWRDIIIAALKGAFVLALLERLFLTTSAEWLEEAVDYYSLQALLFAQRGVSLWGQVRIMYHHTKRLSAEDG